MKVLDTREKIVTYERALECAAGREIVWVSGHFDPLLAEHAGRLAGAAVPGKLLGVIVADVPAALIPLEARARLVAALACVDFVVPGGDRETEDAADPRIREQFERRVRARCGEALS